MMSAFPDRLPFTTRTHCAVCDSLLGRPIISLPRLPFTEIFVNSRPNEPTGFLDQELFFCPRCHHGQLRRIIAADMLYRSHTYFFRTAHSNTAKTANDVFVAFIQNVIGKKRLKTVLEIGCSDVYLLQSFRNSASRLIGIDPILAGRERDFSDRRLTIIGDFYERVDLSDMLGDDTVVVTSHTLEHLSDPRALIVSLFTHATATTTFVFQFPIFDPLVADDRYDQLFHQHVHYFTLASFWHLIDHLGGTIVDAAINYQHWGTLMVAFRKGSGYPGVALPAKTTVDAPTIRRGYRRFRVRMQETQKILDRYRHERLFGFGATNMLPVVGYHLGTDFSSFACILDDDPQKEGVYYCNLPVSIRQPKPKEDFSDATFLITAYSTARNVLPRVVSLRPKRIILPGQII